MKQYRTQWKRLCSLCLSLALLASLWLLPSVPAAAASGTATAAEPATVHVDWEDDFSGANGDPAEFYTPYGLWWNNAVSDVTQHDYTGVLGNESGDNGGYTYYYLKGYTWTDFTLEFDVVSTAADNTTYGIMLRAGNPGPGVDQGDGYAIMYDGAWVFTATENGGFHNLNHSYNPSAHGQHPLTHWKVVCQGNRIQVYFNGSEDPAIDFTDDTYTAGAVGFRTRVPANTEGNIIVDNFKVSGEAVEPEKPPVYDVFWEDDFSGANGNPAERYTPYGIWWNNAYSGNTGTDYTGVLGNEGGPASGYTYYYIKDYEWTNFTMEFDVVSTAASNTTYGVMLRAGDPGPGVDQGDGYAIMYDGAWVFTAIEDGRFHNLNQSYNPSAHGQAPLKHWKIVCQDNRIQVFFNHSESPAISFTDDTYTKGAVGFRTQTPAHAVKNIVIDNFKVSGIAVEKPEHKPEPQTLYANLSAAAAVVDGDNPSLYDLTWNANVVSGLEEDDDFAQFNAQYEIVDSGVLVAANLEDIETGKSLVGTEETKVDGKVYQESFGTTVYSHYSYRRIHVPANRVRVIMTYVVYQDEAGQQYYAYSAPVSMQATAD